MSSLRALRTGHLRREDGSHDLFGKDTGSSLDMAAGFDGLGLDRLASCDYAFLCSRTAEAKALSR